MVTRKELEIYQAKLTRAQKKWEKKDTTKSRLNLAKARSLVDRAKVARKYSRDPFEFYISDHAALRYLQRTLDVDLQQIKQMMVDEVAVEAVYTLGPGKYPLEGGGTLVVAENGTAVTYLA